MRNKDVFLKVIINRVVLILFYILIIGGIGVGGYFIYLSLYDFYFENDEVYVEVGDTKSSGLITKRDFDIKKGDYIYTIEDEDIASVDDEGNIMGIDEGETILEVKYKHSLTTKRIHIFITPYDETNDNIDNQDENK